MSDSEYLDAVRRGDMKTAQRMVDAAAKKAGFTVGPVYHGSDKQFSVFDVSKIGQKHGRSEGAGFYFTTDRSTAEGYTPKGGTLYSVYLKVGKELGFGAKPFTSSQLKKLLKAVAVQEQKDGLTDSWKDGFLANYEDTYSMSLDGVVSKAVSYFEGEKTALDQIGSIVGSGVDAATVNKALTASLGYDTFVSEGFSGGGKSGGCIYVATSPSQIKSADPVTYDDAGNVIPLSQRFSAASDDIRNPKLKSDLIYTKPDLRKRLKAKITAGGKGGLPGEWSARKAQLLASEYQKAGGGYTGARSKVQRSLSRWTKQDWRTKSGKPSLETGERYLPAAAIKALSSAEYAASTKAKRSATGQFSRQPKRIAMKTKRYRNPATPEDMPGLFLKQGSSRDPIPPQRTSSQINTHAFRKWFAGSVVTTRDGDPRMMYHGTGWTNLREFKSQRARGQISGFFAFDPGFAEDFAMLYASGGDYFSEDADESGVIKRPSIYPVYLSLRKVFDVRKKEDRDAINFKETPTGLNGERGWDWTQLEEPRYVRRMREQGFDGYIDFEKGSTSDPTGIAVFDPRNVKSAYGNRGTFDPNDPDIRNPRRSMIRTKLSRIIEPGDRVLDYDRAQGEDLYRLWDMVHTDMPLNEEALTEIEGLLDDDGVLVIQSGEEPAGLRKHFRRATRYQGMLLVQGPLNPEEARINTEKLRRDLE